jgi:integrase
MRRAPHVGVRIDETEAGRHHADDLRRPIADLNDAPDDVRITAEAALPQLLAEDSNARTGWEIVLWRHRPSEQRLDWCVARNVAATNPVRRVKFFNEDNSRLRYLTEDEYERLLQAAKQIETSPQLAEKIILSVHTGLRRRSLFHLQWDQIDFLNRVVRIPRTKSGRPHALPLNETALTTLQALFNARVPDCPFVFAHANGRKAGQPVQDVKNAFHTALSTADSGTIFGSMPGPGLCRVRVWV